MIVRPSVPWSTAITLLLATSPGVAAGAQPTDARHAPAAAHAAVRAQTHGPESGLPLLRSFSPKTYGAQPQNWVVAQDLRGVVYVGNGDGVLEFDGQRWRLIRVANNTIVRSLALDTHGRIHVGAVGDMGTLEPDASGQMRFVSLLDRVPPKMRDFSDVWKIFVTPQGVVYYSNQRLIRQQGDHFESWTPSVAFQRAFQVDDRVFVREPGRGLFELLDGQLHLLPGGERFADEKVRGVLPWQAATPGGKPRLLIGTSNNGFFVLDADGFAAWPTEIDAELKRDLLYTAISLPRGRLALGTQLGGLYLIDAQGRSLGHLGKADGLPDDAVYALFPDMEGGLWIATDNGLARAEIGSPLSQFDERSGLAGTVNAVHRHRGQLHVATSQGLYRLLPGPSVRFSRVPGINGQTWAFLSVGDELLVADALGVYSVVGDHATQIKAFDAANSLHASAARPGRVYVGGRAGLAVLRQAEGRWLDEGPVPGVNVDDEVRSLLEDSDGALWLGTYSTGIIRVHLAADTIAPKQVERFGVADGLPSLNDASVYLIGGEPRFATHGGIYRFDAAQRRLAPDPRFAGLFEQPRMAYRLDEAAQGIWMHVSDPAGGWKATGLAARQFDGAYRWDPRPLAALTGMLAEAVHCDADGVVWVGGAEGLFRYDPGVAKDFSRPYPAIMRRVSHRGDGLLYAGGGAAAVASVAYASNALRFEYAASSLDGPGVLRYQARLDGSDSEWSDWGAEAYKDYTNLFEGEYRFRVRARNLYDTVSSEATYSFRVLPPWYRTPWAYLGYLLALVGSAWLALRWYLRHLRAQQRALEATVAARTRELRESLAANDALLSQLQAKSAQLERQSREDTLTGLANRRHFDERLQAEIQQAKGGGAGFALVLIDLDHFKRVNDRYGHAGGDEVLRLLAAVMRRQARATGLQARIGGEEFAWLLPGQDSAGAAEAADDLRAALAAQDCSGIDPQLVVTLSAGVAGWHAGCEADTMLRRADEALYRSKAAGRNRVSVAPGSAQDAQPEGH